MSKSVGHTPPVVEEVKSAVIAQGGEEAKLDKSLKFAAEVPVTTPADIHKNAFNTFVQFLKGEVHNASVEARTEYQCQFMDGVTRMLKVDYHVVEAVLDHWVITIHQNRRLFGINDLFAPLYNVARTDSRSPSDIQRYKALMGFMVGLVDNARRRAEYVAQVDVRKLINDFPLAAQQNLNNFIYR